MFSPNKVTACLALSICLNIIQNNNNSNLHNCNKRKYNKIIRTGYSFNEAIEEFNKTQNRNVLYRNIIRENKLNTLIFDGV